MDAAELVRDADKAVVARDFARAVSLLEQAAAISPADGTLWMRIAAIRRGTGDASAALDAVHKVLAIAPRDFTALLMRASLLQKLELPGAGEAWGHALAQKPERDLPEQLTPVIAEAEEKYAQWQARREAALKARMAEAEQQASEEE